MEKKSGKKGGAFMWVTFALLSAVFAALTSILAKIGIEGVNSNLATAIRTAVVLVLAWGIVFATGAHHEISSIGTRSWLDFPYPLGRCNGAFVAVLLSCPPARRSVKGRADRQIQRRYKHRARICYTARKGDLDYRSRRRTDNRRHLCAYSLKQALFK